VDADDLDSDEDSDADDEIVGDEGSKESGGCTSYVYGEVEDDDSVKLEDDNFADSTKKSDAVEEVAAARADRSTGRALSQIALLEARAGAPSSREEGMNAQSRPLQTWTPVDSAEDVQLQRWTY
jgi:hypothetical protein